MKKRADPYTKLSTTHLLLYINRTLNHSQQLFFKYWYHFEGSCWRSGHHTRDLPMNCTTLELPLWICFEYKSLTGNVWKEFVVFFSRLLCWLAGRCIPQTKYSIDSHNEIAGHQLILAISTFAKNVYYIKHSPLNCDHKHFFCWSLKNKKYSLR